MYAKYYQMTYCTQITECDSSIRHISHHNLCQKLGTIHMLKLKHIRTIFWFRHSFDIVVTNLTFTSSESTDANFRKVTPCRHKLYFNAVNVYTVPPAAPSSSSTVSSPDNKERPTKKVTGKRLKKVGRKENVTPPKEDNQPQLSNKTKSRLKRKRADGPSKEVAKKLRMAATSPTQKKVSYFFFPVDDSQQYVMFPPDDSSLSEAPLAMSLAITHWCWECKTLSLSSN